ncbi:hypothetical protein [Paraburkholderia silvatlantica]|uniref:Uncharacterized protein n=1 Tax=Paraburkholderia silvatlantica TaxID=321895 RepID=A0A2V4TPQ9_9BURK|nr:hypothetical protein [Paraburkholderia silvatlantica]PYE18236.1 hypothetical protein C7410_12352 [Paraburkholderia silvatlantica]TDQ79041.1 hypothetical protein C7412_12954 [Paraburkholderia silvatlantica]
MIVELLKSQPGIALFASLALVLGQTGARISPDLRNIAFALMGPVVVGPAAKFG